MQNFDYRTPTRLIFGRDVLRQLPDVLRPLGTKILLTYGGGSIKKTGLYDQILSLLSGFEIAELSGIAPNPRYDPSVLDGVRICKERGIQAILAVGGGSVLDCSKAIAAGALHDGDPWDLITGKIPLRAALPVVSVMTMAATGSEYDAAAVISRADTDDKVCLIAPPLFPVASFVDPAHTFTVPRRQMLAGVADAFDHVLEQYFNADPNDLADGMMESVMRSLAKNVRRALANPADYDARAEISLACTLACNGILSLGEAESGWPMHALEHALSAYYDITHGEGLAILAPHWMRHILSDRTAPRLARYGVNVLGVSPALPIREAAQEAITRTHDLFASLGIPMRLRDVGIDASRLPEMARHVAQNEGVDSLSVYVPLTESAILSIFHSAL
jgi:alcohol dehydrogenase YqhD (iron-dependent ADH family)